MMVPVSVNGAHEADTACDDVTAHDEVPKKPFDEVIADAEYWTLNVKNDDVYDADAQEALGTAVIIAWGAQDADTAWLAVIW